MQLDIIGQTNIMTPPGPYALTTEALNVHYGDKHALHDASLKFTQHTITALIGASGSGKSTYLRSLNRMNDQVADVTGKIQYHDVNINAPAINVYEVRQHIGMVFQRPNPFAKSIWDNLTLALVEQGVTDQTELARRVEESLTAAALWDEVKDQLRKSALALSGGQQQRLCIARALTMKPEILLLDEPASALDPLSTAKLEETLLKLRADYTMIIVTHNMQQASRISDYTAFFQLGQVIEYDRTDRLFTTPQVQLTEDYISGNFG